MRRENFNAAAHGLRGIASLMVFYAHLLGGTAEHIYEHNSTYVEVVRYPWNFGVYGVELFFVISGFVITPSALRYTLGEFAIRRFMRLYPLFISFTIIFAILNYLTNEYKDINNGYAVLYGALFLNLFFRTEQITPNAWSLTYEVIYYVLTALIIQFWIRKPNKILGVAVAACAVYFFIAYPISLYFIAGVLVRILYDRGAYLSFRIPWLLEGALIVLCVILACQDNYRYKWEDFLNPVVVPLAIATALMFYLAVREGSLLNTLLNRPFFLYFGTVSYSLYLVHPYTYYLCRLLFVKLGLFTNDVVFSMALFFAVATAITLVATHLAHITLERWPYAWFFRQGIYRERRSPT